MDDRDILQPETLLTRDMRLNVKEAEAGQPLAAYLASRFTYHDHAAWCRLIDEGRVTLNGNPAAIQHPLAVGDRIQYDASGIPEPPVDDTFAVVWEDADLLAVNKSGNLPCHPGGRYFNHTLWALLQTRCGYAPPVFINRLDRETSGVVLIAKNRRAAAHLWRQFAAHRVDKRYTVYVEGRFPERIDAAGWLLPDTASVIRKKRRWIPAVSPAAAPVPDAEWCETAFTCLSCGNGISRVTAEPCTGRLHQIRATLFSLGFPVTGDKVYGVDETAFLRFCTDALTEVDHMRLRIKRQALHAAWLRFRHPVTQSWVEVEAPLPSDMAALNGLCHSPKTSTSV